MTHPVSVFLFQAADDTRGRIHMNWTAAADKNHNSKRACLKLPTQSVILIYRHPPPFFFYIHFQCISLIPILIVLLLNPLQHCMVCSNGNKVLVLRNVVNNSTNENDTIFSDVENKGHLDTFQNGFSWRQWELTKALCKDLFSFNMLTLVQYNINNNSSCQRKYPWVDVHTQSKRVTKEEMLAHSKQI